MKATIAVLALLLPSIGFAQVQDKAHNTYTLVNGEVQIQAPPVVQPVKACGYTANATQLFEDTSGNVWQFVKSLGRWWQAVPGNGTCGWTPATGTTAAPAGYNSSSSSSGGGSSSSSSSGAASSSGSGSSSGASSSGSGSSSGPVAFGIKRCGAAFCDLNGNKKTPKTADVSGMETGVASRWLGFLNAGAKGTWKAMKAAGYDAVRIPLNASNWNGRCDGGSGKPASYYQGIVKQAFSDAIAAGLLVLDDLHWSAPNVYYGGCAIGQPNFADVDNAVPFWKDQADLFGSNPAVVFEVLNEPFGSNSYGNWVTQTGSTYKPGADAITERDGGSFVFQAQYNGAWTPSPAPKGSAGSVINTGLSFQVAGTQQLVNVIRGEHATNLILVAPIGWAGEIEAWLGPTDPAGDLGASWHLYGYRKGQAPVTGLLASQMPIWITESSEAGLGPIGGIAWLSSEGIPCAFWLNGNTWGGGDLGFDATQKCN